nr:signal peptidase II [Candidatus Gracilibacteria bacterium]
MVKNPGIAFSINFPFLKIITILIIIGIIFYFLKYEKKKNNLLTNLSFSLIIGGALGNARERLIYSGVTDFIGIKFFSIFNFADIFLSIGVIIYLSLIVLKKDNDGI